MQLDERRKQIMFACRYHRTQRRTAKEGGETVNTVTAFAQVAATKAYTKFPCT